MMILGIEQQNGITTDTQKKSNTQALNSNQIMKDQEQEAKLIGALSYHKNLLKKDTE